MTTSVDQFGRHVRQVTINATGEDNLLKTPVVIVGFGRPQKTQKVFDEIKKVRPEKLFAIFDGPRHEQDRPHCEAVRAIIDQQVDWPCQVYTQFPPTNLRCKPNMVAGFNWVFENVEEAIILEDDCIPETTFFYYCQELLEKYRHEPRILDISGTNFNVRQKNFKCNDGYFFSNYGWSWGWATWRRAWQYYDVDIKYWPELKKDGTLQRVLQNDEWINYFEYMFDRYYTRTVDAWDGQWYLTHWWKNALSIVPSHNLIRNIGFEGEIGQSLHGINHPDHIKANIPTQPMAFPLKHPQVIKSNREADDWVYRHIVGINLQPKQKLLWLLKSRFPKIHQWFKDRTKTS